MYSFFILFDSLQNIIIHVFYILEDPARSLFGASIAFTCSELWGPVSQSAPVSSTTLVVTVTT